MASKDIFAERGRALEDQFFRDRERELVQRLNAEAETEAGREALRKVTGIADAKVLDGMLKLGIDAETMLALTLVPLIQVAWADRQVDAEERDQVLKAAAAAGVTEDSPSHALLSEWLQEKPSHKLFQLWQSYIGELREAIGAEELQLLKSDITTRAKAVAEATGGILGIAKTSGTEATVLEQIEQAFGG